MLRVWVVLFAVSVSTFASEKKLQVIPDQWLMAQSLELLQTGSDEQTRLDAKAYETEFKRTDLQAPQHREYNILRAVAILSAMEEGKTISQESWDLGLNMIRALQHALLLVNSTSELQIVQKALLETPARRKFRLFKTEEGKLHAKNLRTINALLRDGRRAQYLLAAFLGAFYDYNSNLQPMGARFVLEYLMAKHFPCRAAIDNPRLN